MSEAVKKQPSPADKFADSPWRDPVAWLLARKWEPQGDPYLPQTRWMDPEGADHDRVIEVPVMRWDEQLKKDVPLMLKEPGKKEAQVVQKRVISRRLPISRSEAIAAAAAREKKG